VSLVPSSARRLWRDDVAYLELDETKMVAPIIMSHRLSDKSAELSQLKKLIREFDQWHSQ
jgi:LysR family transcriptional regulator, benzoate and cis,cis-muconate-responsive activator of ben and cat genes